MNIMKVWRKHIQKVWVSDMARYIDADALYKETEKKIAGAHSYRMAVVDDEFLDLINDAFTEDVAPKGEIAKEVLLEFKKQIHDKAVYPNSQDIPSYVNLKVFDAVLNNCIKKYTDDKP